MGSKGLTPTQHLTLSLLRGRVGWSTARQIGTTVRTLETLVRAGLAESKPLGSDPCGDPKDVVGYSATKRTPKKKPDIPKSDGA